MSWKISIRAAISLIFILVPGLALAHTGTNSASGFLHGMAHPLGGFDHMLAMITVGVLAVQIGGRAIILIPAVFVGSTLLGASFGASGIEMPGFEIGIGLSIMVLGAAVMFGRQLNAGSAVALVGLSAIFHGYAHGSEMVASDSGLYFGAGFAIVTAALHGLGVSSLLLLRWGMRTRTEGAVSLFGGAVSLAGIGFLSASF